MRILHLLSSRLWSGASESVVWLALAQRALGHQVYIATDRLKQTPHSYEALIQPVLESFDLAYPGSLSDKPLWMSDKSKPWHLLSDIWHLKKTSFDVLHSHLSHDHYLAYWGLPKGALLVRSIHTVRALRRTLPKAHGYTCFNEHMCLQCQPAMVLSALIDESIKPLSVQKRDDIRAQMGFSKKTYLIGMASTFKPKRRHDLALEVFKQYVLQSRQSVHLLLAGDGELESDIRTKIHTLGLNPYVSLIGYLSLEEYRQFLPVLDELWVFGLENDYAARIGRQAKEAGLRLVAVDEGALKQYADVRIAALPAQDRKNRDSNSVFIHQIASTILAGNNSKRQPYMKNNLEIAAQVVEFYKKLITEVL